MLQERREIKYQLYKERNKSQARAMTESLPNTRYSTNPVLGKHRHSGSMTLLRPNADLEVGKAKTMNRFNLGQSSVSFTFGLYIYYSF